MNLKMIQNSKTKSKLLISTGILFMLMIALDIDINSADYTGGEPTHEYSTMRHTLELQTKKELSTIAEEYFDANWKLFTELDSSVPMKDTNTAGNNDQHGDEVDTSVQ